MTETFRCFHVKLPEMWRETTATSKPISTLFRSQYNFDSANIFSSFGCSIKLAGCGFISAFTIRFDPHSIPVGFDFGIMFDFEQLLLFFVSQICTKFVCFVQKALTKIFFISFVIFV